MKQQLAMPTPAAPTSRLDRLLMFIEHDAGNLTLRKDAIREACDTQRWELARTLIDAGLQEHPAEAQLLAFRAFVQFMQKHYADALQLLGDAGLVRTLPFALLLRARCLHHLHRPQEAIADCNAYLAAVPGDAETHGLLALLLYEQRQGEAAKPHLEAALSRDPQQPDALLALGCLQVDAEDHDAARRSFNALLEVHPECGRAWYGLAMLELAQMRIEAAMRHIERAAIHMPEHVGTWHVLAWIHLMLGDVAAAAIAFGRAFALDRTFAETHGGLAVIAALQGREDDARASIKRALRLNPQCMSQQYAEVLLLQRHGRHGEAQVLLDAFLARPTHPDEGDARVGGRFRDLVALQMQHLRAGAGEHAAAPVLH